MRLFVNALVRDEGTVVVFEATEVVPSPLMSGLSVAYLTGRERTRLLVVDHRMAQDIVDALENGPWPVYVEAEPWQLL